MAKRKSAKENENPAENQTENPVEQSTERSKGLVVLERFVKLPVARLALAAWNYKTDNAEMMEKLRNNLKLHGQVENLIVRELDTGYFEVVNGNHRVRALQDLEQESAICFNLGRISDAQAKRIAIETNETKFTADNLKLAELLQEVGQEIDMGDLLATMPYDQQALEDFGKLVNFEWPSEDQTPGGDGGTLGDEDEDEAKVVTCPHCGAKFKLR